MCYADDLCLISCNVNYLGHLLSLVEQFALDWRLEFTSPEASKTKSHCIIFGNDMLLDTPKWFIDEQQLRVEVETEHLGTVVASNLQAKQHVSQRMKRARGSFYGLTPAGILSTKLSTFRQGIFVAHYCGPVPMTFGATAVPLRPEDISELERFQARHIKAALGLAPQTHHSALLAALGVPNVQEVLRSMVLRGF